MKRFTLSLALIAGLLVAVPPTARAANLNQCLQISNIRTTIQGDQISVNADVSQVCSEYTPVSGGLNAYSPLYELKPHAITCSGPSLRRGRISLGVLGLPLGQVVCSGKSQSYGVGTSSLTVWEPLSGGIVQSFAHTPISRLKKLADCIEFANPRSSNSSSVFTLSVDAYSICNYLTREGQVPVVGMLEEDSLLTLGACRGVALNATITGRSYLGTISCQLRVGSESSFLASSRYGATSTTLNLFFAWDLSRANVSVSHPAIPPTADRLATDKAAAELKARQEAEARAAAELRARQEADAKVTIDATNEARAAEDAATDAALAAAEAAEAATSVAQVASDAVAALSETVTQLIADLQAQIKSLSAIVAKLAKR